ncbi:MAG: creatininase family protein [Planctomycetes bacterium]|nr:creatininase family protein [Planctomycetota bacterium]
MHLGSAQTTIPLLELPHAEARRLLATGVPVYLPVNPIEYHGPHLSLRTDHLLGLALARDLHARLAQDRPDWPFVVAGAIDAGVDPCPGPGSRPASFRVVRDLAVRACDALVDLGAARVVVTTFHGAPLHSLALHAAVRHVRARGGRALQPLNLLLRELLVLEPARFAEAFAGVPDAAERQAMQRDLASDFHAGFFETSLALHYAPDSVSASLREVPPCPPFAPSSALEALSRLAQALGRSGLAAELLFGARGLGWTRLRPFPGYTGRPHRASAEAGAFFAREILRLYEPAARAVLLGAGTPPPPIFGWLPALTLGGRLAGMSVPLRNVAGTGGR